jgi:hypothetical protein
MAFAPRLCALAVSRDYTVVCHFGAQLHMGAGLETEVRTFDLPDDAAAYIRAQQGCNCSVTLALETTTEKAAQP